MSPTAGHLLAIAITFCTCPPVQAPHTPSACRRHAETDQGLGQGWAKPCSALLTPALHDLLLERLVPRLALRDLVMLQAACRCTPCRHWPCCRPPLCAAEGTPSVQCSSYSRQSVCRWTRDLVAACPDDVYGAAIWQSGLPSHHPIYLEQSAQGMQKRLWEAIGLHTRLVGDAPPARR